MVSGKELYICATTIHTEQYAVMVGITMMHMYCVVKLISQVMMNVEFMQ